MSAETAVSYSKEFFDDIQDGASSSSQVILPYVFDLLSPRSVVDVGCGRGAWLRSAMQLGIPRVLGLDGSYVTAESLLIPRDCFQPTDLSRPFRIPGEFDLAMCLEVAEHLPRRTSDDLVHTLTSAAPAILFSAAIPGQQGTHHINEQFPEFWCRRFEAREFVALDPIRPRLARDRRVEPWYAQNMLLYVHREYYARMRELQPYAPINDPADLLPWVNGGIWRSRVRWRGALSILKLMWQRSRQ